MNTPLIPRAAAPRRDWFLLTILLGLAGLLVAAGLAIVLVRQPVPILPADSPGGTVQQFYLALGGRDYDKAYSLLSRPLQDKTTRAAFTQLNMGRFGSQNAGQDARVRLAAETTHGDDAVVTLTTTHDYTSGLPFGSSGSWSESEVFTLQREAGAWRLTALPPAYLPYPQP